MAVFVWYLFVAVLCKTGAVFGELYIDRAKNLEVSVCCSFVFCLVDDLIVIQSRHTKRDPKPGGKWGPK